MDWRISDDTVVQPDNLVVCHPVEGAYITRAPELVFEILMRKDVPVSVSISEAVILAKRYSTEEAKSYINAVLGKIEPGEKE